VITRRSQYELDKARARAHILDGLLIALANLDDVINTIRQSPDAETAKTRLMQRFKLSDLQAQAILDMQLRRLAALERQKIQDEHRDVMARIAYLEDLLAHPKQILKVIQDDLKELAEKYGDERRTRIAADAKEEFKEEDLVADESILISITLRGYIKRVSASVYRTQSRGGRGVTGQAVKEEDEVLMLIPARTLNTMLFFSDKGKVYSEKAYQIPDAGRADRGIPLVNILTMEPGEKITAAVSIPGFEVDGFCTMATLKGRLKRVSLSEFSAVRPSGLIAITLEVGDELGWVRLTRGEDDIMLVTAGGQALRTCEKNIRPMGRPAAGVAGIKLSGNDRVASMEVVEADGDLLVVTEQGYGKRTPLSEYAPKGRATGGMATINQASLEKIGRIAVARVVQKTDDITLITSGGIVLRLKVDQVSQSGRSTRGVRLMGVPTGDRMASLARISAAELQKSGVVDNGTANGETPGDQPRLIDV
jgi:DNA gyrase subunit A